ncbi:MAG TPA: MFS transporter [Verrucomicrobiae bacterium]|nr:MFS transporter [Verrucomicrobiae bacterium]
MTPVSRKPRQTVAGNFRWLICALLFTATVINYLDRQMIGIFKPELAKIFHWSERDYAWIVASFQAAYACGEVLSGPFIEWVGIKGAYAIAIVLWSLATIGHAPIASVFGFCAARFALGIGESANWPAAVRTVTEWFPQRERSAAIGIFNAGSNVGSIVGPVLIPLLALQLGWQAAFVVLGAIGFVWVSLWFILYEAPGKSRWLGAEERAHILAGASHADERRLPWRSVIRHRETWAYVSSGIFTAPVWWFFLFWLPDFYGRQFGFNSREFGIRLAAIYAAAALGSIGGGGLSAALLRRGWTINGARKGAGMACACCALPVMFATRANHAWLATVCFALAAAANQGWSSIMFTAVSDMFPKRAVASVVGFGGMCSSLVAVGFSRLVGGILQNTGVYDTILIYCGAAYMAALVAFHLLVPQIKPIEIERRQEN